MVGRPLHVGGGSAAANNSISRERKVIRLTSSSSHSNQQLQPQPEASGQFLPALLYRSLPEPLMTHHCSYQWQECSKTQLTGTERKHCHPRCRLQHKWRQSWPLHSCWARRRCSRWWLACRCSWWAHLHAGTIQAGALCMQANADTSADCTASKHRKTLAQP